MAQANTSLTDRVIPVAAGAEVVTCGFLSRTPVFALADGTILFCGIDAERRVLAHPDAVILTAQILGDRIVTGGDDGRVVETRADGAMTLIGDEKGRWIDALALRDDGATAWAAAKNVRARDARGEVKELTAPSGVRGLCFMPKGYRVAVSHYNGISMWFPTRRRSRTRSCGADRILMS